MAGQVEIDIPFSALPHVSDRNGNYTSLPTMPVREWLSRYAKAHRDGGHTSLPNTSKLFREVSSRYAGSLMIW